MKIIVFGQLKDIIKQDTVDVPELSSLSALKQELIHRFPRLAAEDFMIAIDHKIIYDDILISPQSEIALLPPFSGG